MHIFTVNLSQTFITSDFVETFSVMDYWFIMRSHIVILWLIFLLNIILLFLQDAIFFQALYIVPGVRKNTHNGDSFFTNIS